MNSIIVYWDDIVDKFDTYQIIDKFIYDSFMMVLSPNEYAQTGLLFEIATNNGNPNECFCKATFVDLEKGQEVYIGEFNWSVNGEYATVEIYEKDRKYEEAYVNWASNIYAIMSYIMTTERKRVKKQRPVQMANSKKKHKAKSKNKSIYLLSEIVDYVNDNGLLIKPSGNHKITCPCWSVRGHYRTYKSGKKVFVRPFEKGRERGKAAPKQHTYVV